MRLAIYIGPLALTWVADSRDRVLLQRQLQSIYELFWELPCQKLLAVGPSGVSRQSQLGSCQRIYNPVGSADGCLKGTAGLALGSCFG